MTTAPRKFGRTAIGRSLGIAGRLWLIGLAGVPVIALAAPETASPSELEVSGFIRGQVAASTTKNNPANAALGLQSNQDINLAKVFGVMDLSYKPTLGSDAPIDGLKLFARTRLNIDATQDLGSGTSPYNAFPTRYKNDGTLLRTGGDKAKVEIWEIFADVSAGNAWWRLGRQNIVWGEADAIRLLDVVNALDMTQHAFIEAGGEQFDHARIPVWALRGTYKLPFAPKYSIDAFVIPGDFVPTWQSDRGAPFNLNPLPLNAPAAGPVGLFPPGMRIENNVDQRRGDAEAGIRLLGEVNNVKFTLNYLSKIDQDGVTVFDSFDLASNQVVLRNQHDRLNIAGASFNGFSETLGAVIRGEMTHTPNQRYANANPAGAPILKIDTTRFVLGFDRPTFVFNTDAAMTVSLQWFQTHRDLGGQQISIFGVPGDKSETNFSLYLSQPVMNNQLFAEFLAVYDTDGAYWLQPQIRYTPGNKWRFALYANAFGGNEKRPGRLGSLRDVNEINFSVTRQF